MTDEQATIETPSPTTNPAPLCLHLRSKRMYVHNSFEVEAQADENVESCYGHYWCMKTMYEIGPDNGRVQRKVCKPGRSCYEAS
ncbi:MAG: hypothetical protein JO316_13395 [Abitibacteriaceae bacterium]|nr:hypothetical protein [Abditibacteriaceae bacterium]MBV9866341.1 hypothetical protein [Abditibacteriaceae bacterium]